MKLLKLVTSIATETRLSGNMLPNISGQKWMVEFFTESENHGHKIARVYSICITNSINLL